MDFTPPGYRQWEEKVKEQVKKGMAFLTSMLNKENLSSLYLR